MTTLTMVFILAGNLIFGQAQFNSLAACEAVRVELPEGVVAVCLTVV